MNFFQLRIIFERLRREKVMYFLFLFTLFVLGLFLIYPIIVLFYMSFIDPAAHHFSFYNYKQLFLNRDIYQSFVGTIQYGVWTVILSAAFAVPMAFGVSRTDMPCRKFIRTASILTFASPSFIGAIAWIILLGPRAGRLNMLIKTMFGIDEMFNIFSFSGMVFVSALFLYPFIFFSMVSALDNMDSSFEDAATILGANKIRTLFTVTLPMVIPAILAGMILVFLECFVLFGIPVILGLPAGVYVMSTKIYHLFLANPPQFEIAAAVATPILMITAILLLLEWLYLKRRRYVTVAGKLSRPEPVQLGRWKVLLSGYSLFIVFLAVILPSMTLLASSFLRYWGGSFSWENVSLFQFKELLFGFNQQALIVALKNSFLLGVGSAFLAVVFSLIMAWIVERTNVPGRNILSFLNTSAMSFPAVALALALILCFSSPPLPLYGTLWIFLVGYMVKGFPISFLLIRSSLKQISAELEEASRILGGSWFKSVKDITIPLIKGGLFSTFLIIFITKFRDLPTSILLYTGGNEIIGVTIFQYIDEGLFGQASALSSFILLFNLAIVYIANRIAGKDQRSF